MKFDIVFGILLTLSSRLNTTATYLANKYDISVRTVYRYISILSSNNIPIITKPGRGGGIRLLNKIYTPLYFTEQEKLVMLSLTQSLTNQPLKLSIQTKLLALR